MASSCSFKSSFSSSSSSSTTFLYKTLGTPPLRRNVYEKGGGAGGLQIMCIRTLLNHLELLDQGSLDGLPEGVVRWIWKEIEKSNLESFHIWRLFVAANPDCPPSRLHQTITHHRPPFSQLIPLINSSSLPLTFLISLTLVDLPLSPLTSLHQLSKLDNLVTLSICSDSGTKRENCVVDDEVLRLMSKQARYAGGFCRLKMLFLRFQVGVTARGMQELQGFGSLELCLVSRCGGGDGKKTKKQSRGFEVTSKSSLHAYTETALSKLQAPSQQGIKYLDLITGYIKSQASTFTIPAVSSSSTTATSTATFSLPAEATVPPLALLQLGRHERVKSTHMIYSVDELECWVRDPEFDAVKGGIDEGGKRGNDAVHVGKRDEQKKKRKIKEGKKIDFMQLLGGM